MAIPAQGQSVNAFSADSSQSDSDQVVQYYDRGGQHELGLWMGYSFNSIILWAKTPDATLEMMGMQYNRKFLRVDNKHSIKYTLDLNLMATYTYPSFTTNAQRTSVNGIGLAPFGFQIDFYDDQRVSPFFKSSAGFIHLETPFPDSRGARFNFTLEFGTGLQFHLTNRLSLYTGYKYHHMSNGETAIVNPGIDSNFLYGGLTIH